MHNIYGVTNALSMRYLIQTLEESLLEFPMEALKVAARAYGVSQREARLILVAEEWTYNKETKLFTPKDEYIFLAHHLAEDTAPLFDGDVAKDVIQHRLNNFSALELTEFRDNPPKGWIVKDKYGDPLWEAGSGYQKSMIWFADLGNGAPVQVQLMNSVPHYAQLIADLDIGE